MKKYRILKCLLCCASYIFLGMFLSTSSAMAGSGVITLSTADSQPQVGNKFSVVIEISAADGLKDADFYLDYDESMVKFLTGGDSVTGGKGTLRVKSTGNTETVSKMTFSIQFKTLKKGAVTFSVIKKASVTDGDGESMSVSSNRLSVDIMKKGSKKAVSSPAPDGLNTKSPKLNNNANLKSLRFGETSLAPEFSSAITKYQMTVPNTTDTILYSAIPENEKASIRVTGNEGLREGDNTLTIQVVSESGKTREYTVICKRETIEETTARKQKESKAAGNTGIGFSVKSENGVITLKNEYEFTVQEVKDQTKIPAGYVATSIQINGIEIPAYTMQNDLDNNYLLLYLKGPDGTSEVYQYDRKEKSLQRYTGDMIQKVNQAGEKQTPAVTSPDRNTVILVCVVIGLIAVILLIFAYLLKISARNRKKKQVKADRRDSFDDIHF